MIDLDKVTVEIPCPRCHFWNAIFFKQVRLRDVIICRGCKCNIHLDDRMNECRKAVRDIKAITEDFAKTWGNLNIKMGV